MYPAPTCGLSNRWSRTRERRAFFRLRWLRRTLSIWLRTEDVTAADVCWSCAGPSGAVCPGGNRAWSLPGFWKSEESSIAVEQCLPPADERCVGWNVSIGSVQCGVGYKAGSAGCSQCDLGYYPVLTSCVACPRRGIDMVTVIGTASVLFAAVCTYAIVTACRRARRQGEGGSSYMNRVRGLAFYVS